MSFPKRPGVPCSPTGQRRSFSVTMSVPDTRFSQNPVGLSDSGNLRATESVLKDTAAGAKSSSENAHQANEVGSGYKDHKAMAQIRLCNEVARRPCMNNIIRMRRATACA